MPTDEYGINEKLSNILFAQVSFVAWSCIIIYPLDVKRLMGYIWTNFQDKASFEKEMQILSSAAKFHLNRPQAFWNNVIWTDDTKVQSTDIWPSCTAPHLRKTRYLIPAVKQGGGGVMIWTLFSAMGLGTLQSLSQP